MVKIKFNGWSGAISCETCNVIVSTYEDLPYYFANPSPNEHVFCSEECKKKFLQHIEKQCKIIKLD